MPKYVRLFCISVEDDILSTTKILEMSQADGDRVLKTYFQNDLNMLAQSLVIDERIHILGL